LSAVLVVPALLLVLALAAASADARAPLPQCADNIDNDGDGKIDFPFERDCAAVIDDVELGPATALPVCSNGVSTNNAADGDTKADFPADPGCTSAADTSESNPSPLPACGDGDEDDVPADGKIDWPADPGCSWAAETSETDTACSNHIDDDGDDRIDFPADFGCITTSANALAVNDTTEQDLPQCDDGRDNDGDTNVDFGSDPDCSSLTDNSEAPPTPPPPPVACADGADNDGDGKIDLADPGCSSAADTDETDQAVAYPLPLGNLGTTPLGGSSSVLPKIVRLLTPFPIVRLRGSVEGRLIRVSLLSVRAPVGAKVSVYCAGKGCPARRVGINAGKKLVRIRTFERRLRGGTILKIYVTKLGLLGKYTRFRFVSNRAPVRVDRCASTPGTKPKLCPSS